MNQNWQFVVILGFGVLMTILFWIVFALVVRYLISVFRLTKQVKTAEPELWIALGRPSMLPMFHDSLNPFQGLLYEVRFCNWFLKGGEGATLSETKDMVQKSGRLFRIAMIGFVSLFILFFVLISLSLGMIGMKGTAQPATPPYSEPAPRSP